MPLPAPVMRATGLLGLLMRDCYMIAKLTRLSLGRCCGGRQTGFATIGMVVHGLENSWTTIPIVANYQRRQPLSAVPIAVRAEARAMRPASRLSLRASPALPCTQGRGTGGEGSEAPAT